MSGENLAWLWQAKARGCKEARARLVDRYLRLVPATRRRHFPGIGPQYGEELEAEGRMMLVRCVDDFDHNRGVQFSTYAITRIRGSMSEWLRREDWAPRSVREQERRGEVEPREVVSLDGWLDEYEGQDIPDTARPVEAQVLDKLEAEMVRAVVRALPRREQKLIIARYWEEQSLPSYSLQVNRSPSRVWQWEGEAMARLRRFLHWTGATDAF